MKNPDSPGYEYVDDMFRSQAIEALRLWFSRR